MAVKVMAIRLSWVAPGAWAGGLMGKAQAASKLTSMVTIKKMGRRFRFIGFLPKKAKADCVPRASKDWIKILYMRTRKAVQFLSYLRATFVPVLSEPFGGFAERGDALGASQGARISTPLKKILLCGIYTLESRRKIRFVLAVRRNYDVYRLNSCEIQTG
jgi:hypothetical protein